MCSLATPEEHNMKKEEFLDEVEPTLPFVFIKNQEKDVKRGIFKATVTTLSKPQGIEFEISFDDFVKDSTDYQLEQVIYKTFNRSKDGVINIFIEDATNKVEQAIKSTKKHYSYYTLFPKYLESLDSIINTLKNYSNGIVTNNKKKGGRPEIYPSHKTRVWFLELKDKEEFQHASGRPYLKSIILEIIDRHETLVGSKPGFKTIDDQLKSLKLK